MTFWSMVLYPDEFAEEYDETFSAKLRLVA
jgi:hypothetical protein